MRRILTKAAVIAFATGMMVSTGAVVTATAASASGTVMGCPSGAVCLYPQNAGWNGGHPESNGIFYSYGYHNLSNQYGYHYLFNNQTGGAIARTCTGYNGAGCQGYLYPGYYINKDMTPINSIVLQRS